MTPREAMSLLGKEYREYPGTKYAEACRVLDDLVDAVETGCIGIDVTGGIVQGIFSDRPVLRQLNVLVVDHDIAGADAHDVFTVHPAPGQDAKPFRSYVYSPCVGESRIDLTRLADDLEWGLVGMVLCKFCGNACDPNTAHRHDHGWVCDDCWDERLRTTE